MRSKLDIIRDRRKHNEDLELADAVLSEVYDPRRVHDYKYCKTVANELGWSVGRLQKVTERILA